MRPIPLMHLGISKSVCVCVHVCVCALAIHLYFNKSIAIIRLSHTTRLISLSMSPNNPTLVDLPMCWLKVHFDNHLYQFSLVGYKYIKSPFALFFFKCRFNTHIQIYIKILSWRVPPATESVWK